MAQIRMAVAWLREEDWARLQELDPAMTTFDHWHSKISQAMAGAARKGNVVEKVGFDPDLFLAWCKVNGKEVLSTTRAEYAAVQVAKRDMAN